MREAYRVLGMGFGGKLTAEALLSLWDGVEDLSPTGMSLYMCMYTYMHVLCGFEVCC